VEVIDGYRIRWEIGTFFLILKEGCKIEEIQLKGVKRIETTLALCMVVAWRINQLMRLGRGRIRRCRRKSRLQNEVWQAAHILNKKTVPPLLGEVMQLMARIGGHIGRKSDGEPGVKELCLG
jgi:transposase IS4 family protein